MILFIVLYICLYGLDYTLSKKRMVRFAIAQISAKKGGKSGKKVRATPVVEEEDKFET